MRAINWVASAHHIEGPARAVAWVLANRAKPHASKGTGEAHICWPSLETIAAESGLCEKTVRRCLPDLERGGIGIQRKAIPMNRGRVHLYVVPHALPDSQSGSGGGDYRTNGCRLPDKSERLPDSQSLTTGLSVQGTRKNPKDRTQRKNPKSSWAEKEEVI